MANEYGAHQPPVSTDTNNRNVFKNLNPDEVRLSMECRREAFWYRCVPISAVMMGATQVFVHKGFLKTHSRFGSAGKLIAAGIAGYVIGKFSYIKACQDKFLNLENSQIADVIRRQRGLPVRGHDSTMGESAVFMGSAPGQQVQRDYQGNMDIDTSRTNEEQQHRLDDTFRPSDSVSLSHEQQNNTTKKYTSYDELRKQNRENYIQNMSVGPQVSPPPDSVPYSSGPSSNMQSSSVTPPASSMYSAPMPDIGSRLPSTDLQSQSRKVYTRERRNQYGDIIPDE